jgi:hypothetical protein
MSRFGFVTTSSHRIKSRLYFPPACCSATCTCCLLGALSCRLRALPHPANCCLPPVLSSSLLLCHSYPPPTWCFKLKVQYLAQPANCCSDTHVFCPFATPPLVPPARHCTLDVLPHLVNCCSIVHGFHLLVALPLIPTTRLVPCTACSVLCPPSQLLLCYTCLPPARCSAAHYCHLFGAVSCMSHVLPAQLIAAHRYVTRHFLLAPAIHLVP